MEIIELDGLLYALILRSKDQLSGNSFFISNIDSPLQVGVLSHPSGYVEKPHYHKVRQRLIQGIPQMLYLKEGSFNIDFFDKSNVQFKSVEILKGDIIVLMDGAHGLRVNRNMQAVIAKLGPYMGAEEDKVEINEK